MHANQQASATKTAATKTSSSRTGKQGTAAKASNDAHIRMTRKEAVLEAMRKTG